MEGSIKRNEWPRRHLETVLRTKWGRRVEEIKAVPKLQYLGSGIGRRRRKKDSARSGVRDNSLSNW